MLALGACHNSRQNPPNLPQIRAQAGLLQQPCQRLIALIGLLSYSHTAAFLLRSWSIVSDMRKSAIFGKRYALVALLRCSILSARQALRALYFHSSRPSAMGRGSKQGRVQMQPY